MALVTCPECGREKVSDSAVACPGCGFGIREYFARIKEQQEKEEREKEYSKHAQSVVQSLDDDIKKHQAKRAEILAQEETQNDKNADNQIQFKQINKENGDKKTEEKRTEEQKKQLKQKQRIGEIEKEIADYKSAIKIVLFLAVIAFGVGLCCTAGLLNVDTFTVYLVASGLLMCAFIIYCYIDGKNKELNKVMEDFEEYDRIAQEKALESARIQAEIRRNREEALKKNVPCPVCGSRNTYRIDTLDRATSVAVFGLASGKIGKQYKCRECKHMW